MIPFYKAAFGVLIAVILCLVLSKQSKDHAILLSIFVCSMLLISLAAYFDPIISFFQRLKILGQLNTETMQILLKSLGISLITEFVCVLCTDSGNQALGKSFKMLGTVVIIWIALPLFEQMLDLVELILGEI